MKTKEDLSNYDIRLPDTQEERVEVLESLGFSCNLKRDGSITAAVGELQMTLSSDPLRMSDIIKSISEASAINEIFT